MVNTVEVKGLGPDKTIQIPPSWNDLSKEQLIRIYKIIMAPKLAVFESQTITGVKRIALVMVLLDISEKQMKAWEADCVAAYGDTEGHEMFISELDEVLQVTDFLFDIKEPEEDEEDEKSYIIKLGLTHWPKEWKEIHFLKKNRDKKKRYFAPDNGLENISFYELTYTFTLFEKYMEKPSPEILHRLLAVLFRPGKHPTRKNKDSAYQGDRRMPLLDYEATIDKRAKKMAALHPTIQQLALFWFASCRQAIVTQYGNLFRTKEEVTPGSKEVNDYGWSTVLLNLAGGLVHLDAVAAQNFRNAFTYLSYLEDQRLKEDMAMAKRRAGLS